MVENIEPLEKNEKKNYFSFFKGINFKLLLLFLLILFFAVVITLVVVNSQKTVLEKTYQDNILESELTFSHFLDGDIKTMSSNIDSIATNLDFKKAFLNQDRNLLYDLSEPLFLDLKNNFSITHFYYVMPDKNIFLRVHNQNIFGDLANRITMQKAIETNKIGSGLELGKTAFALRVVKPYFDNKKLIGYLELGEEINHLVQKLTLNAKNELILFLDKKYVDENGWATMRKNVNERNNWSDNNFYVAAISATERLDTCFDSKTADFVLSGKYFYYATRENNIDFACGGFPLKDASGRKIGAIVGLFKSDDVAGVQATTNSIMFFNVLLVFSIIISVFLIQIIVISPLSKISKMAKQIENKDFSARVDIKSNDEFSDLAFAFNNTAQALQKMDEEHKQVDKIKTEFLSITSHELRSPMTPMRAQLQMLLGNYFGKLNSKQTEAAEIVLRNTERLDKIIQDFLEISRIEAARLKFNFIQTSLTPYINRLIDEMKGFLPEKKITLELKSEKLPVIEVDPDRAMQVLRNLINNAIKFSPEKGKITIVVDVQERNKQILFSVKDEGIGIAPENQSRLFEPFYQEEQTMYRKYGGTGLGLAICKGIIESQKGKIWFESKGRDKGTIFYFTIPFTPTKDIEPIRLLFSQRAGIEEKIQTAFTDFLGPLGKMEFNNYAKAGLVKEKILNYIKEIQKLGIIDKTSAEKFSAQVVIIFDKK